MKLEQAKEKRPHPFYWNKFSSQLNAPFNHDCCPNMLVMLKLTDG